MTRSISKTVAAFCLFALGIAAGISGGQAVAGDPSAAKRVLIVTGEDYPGHHWRKTTPVLVAHLKKDPRLQVTTLEDLKALAAVDLGKYDAVVVAFRTMIPPFPVPSAEAPRLLRSQWGRPGARPLRLWGLPGMARVSCNLPAASGIPSCGPTIRTARSAWSSPKRSTRSRGG